MLAGWNHEIGSHMVNHLQRSDLNREDLAFELGRSREAFDSRLEQVRHAAFGTLVGEDAT